MGSFDILVTVSIIASNTSTAIVHAVASASAIRRAPSSQFGVSFTYLKSWPLELSCRWSILGAHALTLENHTFFGWRKAGADRLASFHIVAIYPFCNASYSSS